MKAFNKIWLLAPLAILGAACGKTATDDAALKNDLALASQAQQFMPPQVMSPAEQGYAVNPYTTPQRQTVTRVSAPARTTTARRAPARSTVVYSEPAPTRVIKNTKRDAAIGAAAGAIIGATTSRDKVKGGLIGAAAGAILGGVIGNNVDVKRVPY